MDTKRLFIILGCVVGGFICFIISISLLLGNGKSNKNTPEENFPIVETTPEPEEITSEIKDDTVINFIVELDDYDALEGLIKEMEKPEIVGQTVDVTGKLIKVGSKYFVSHEKNDGTKFLGVEFKIDGFAPEEYPDENQIINIKGTISASGYISVYKTNFEDTGDVYMDSKLVAEIDDMSLFSGDIGIIGTNGLCVLLKDGDKLTYVGSLYTKLNGHTAEIERYISENATEYLRPVFTEREYKRNAEVNIEKRDIYINKLKKNGWEIIEELDRYFLPDIYAETTTKMGYSDYKTTNGNYAYAIAISAKDINQLNAIPIEKMLLLDSTFLAEDKNCVKMASYTFNDEAKNSVIKYIIIETKKVISVNDLHVMLPAYNDALIATRYDATGSANTFKKNSKPIVEFIKENLNNPDEIFLPEN